MCRAKWDKVNASFLWIESLNILMTTEPETEEKKSYFFIVENKQK